MASTIPTVSPGLGPTPWPAGLVRCRLPVCGLLVAAALGCGRAPPPAEPPQPPATVKWEAPAQAALEEWTELTGTTVPVPDRVARVTAPVEVRVLSVFGVPGS